MIAFACVPAWGYRWAQLALGLWWINVAMSILVNFGMLFMMYVSGHGLGRDFGIEWSPVCRPLLLREEHRAGGIL